MVVVLREADDKFDIVQAAVSVQMLRHSRQLKLPRKHVEIPQTSIQPFTAAVRYAHKWLGKGYRAAVVSDRGWRRIGAVVYALLRCEPGFSAASAKRGSSAAAAKQPRWDVFKRMKEMSGKVHDAIQQKRRVSNEPEVFADRVERHITKPEFQKALASEAPPSATAASARAARIQEEQEDRLHELWVHFARNNSAFNHR